MEALKQSLRTYAESLRGQHATRIEIAAELDRLAAQLPEIVAAWNRRADPRPAAPPGVVKALLDAAYSEPDYLGGGDPRRDEEGLLPPGSPYDQGRCDARKAVRKVLTTLAAPVSQEPVDAERIAKVIAEESANGAACGWKACSGCHETNEGAETGFYPYSKTFGCYVGSGCSECGGLGVVWEHWDKAALDAMARDVASPQPLTEGEPSEAEVWKPITELPRDRDDTYLIMVENVGGTGISPGFVEKGYMDPADQRGWVDDRLEPIERGPWKVTYFKPWPGFSAALLAAKSKGGQADG